MRIRGLEGGMLAPESVFHESAGGSPTCSIKCCKWATAEAVKKLQGLLRIGADGDLGPKTKAAVAKIRQPRGCLLTGL
jgi:hypothetical protein